MAALAIPTIPTPGHNYVVHDATLLSLTPSYFKLSFLLKPFSSCKESLTFYVKAQLYRSRDAELHSGNWMLPANLPAKWRLLPNSY